MKPMNDDFDLGQFHRGSMPLPPMDLMSVLFEDMRSHEEGDVAPNTAGADFFFIQYFMTDDMYWDFDRIEEDFMKHCYDKLRDFANVQYYEHTAARYSEPDNSHRIMVMGLILNGAKSGDEYCKGLIRYLFKTYHKTLYKQLKRFNRISVDEILSLAHEDGSENADLGLMGIILTMCFIDNIQLQEKVYVLYRFLDKRRKDFEREDEEDVRYVEFADGLFEECREQVEMWMEEDVKAHPQFRKQCKTYWDENEFVGACLRHQGYPDDYLYKCMENNMGLAIQFTRTLAVLRTAYPKREFTFEEVQKYTHLYSAISALIDVSENFDSVNREFLGLEPDYDDWDEETLFHPENIVVSSAPKAKEEKKVLTNVAPVEKDNTSSDDYLAEIAELRKKLNQKEMECKQLKSQFAAANSAKKETEQLLNKYENDRNELIALREFAYRLEQEVPEIQQTSVDEMKAAIADKSYVIIGGHVNWVNKLKSEFPNWTFILPSAYKTVDAGGLDNKDMIFFFTDHISHVAYGKFVAIARERNIPFSYLHGVNMEQIIKQIYESGK